MPVYPGTEPPEFLVPCTIAVDGFTEKKLTLYSHTGTHMDAPAHILEGAPTLDHLPAARSSAARSCLISLTWANRDQPR
jgi:kynurenine formamidase